MGCVKLASQHSLFPIKMHSVEDVMRVTDRGKHASELANTNTRTHA
jgi:hypothetical protein